MEPRIAINLASEPFRRDRAMLVASGAVGLLLAAMLVGLLWLIAAERSRVAGSHEAVKQAEAELASLRSETSRLEAVLRDPANSEVLDRSVFLNALLRRKSVSWTRLFADLEKVMPHSVRLISVRPALTAGNQVYLDMVVGSQNGEAVIEFLKRLERSDVFGSAFPSAFQPPTENEPLYRYRISVNYDQRL